MTLNKVVRILVWISRLALIALFILTAGAKLTIIKGFAVNVGELLGATHVNLRWMWPITIGVIAAELIAALLLMIPRTVRCGAVLGAVMLIAFSAFALYYVYVLHGEPLECGCFGKIMASQLGLTTALRNLALLVPALLVVFGYRRHRKISATPQVQMESI